MMEIETMSAKILPAIVAGLLLGTTSLTSAQALVVPQYGYNYSYYASPVYPPEVTFGFGAAPGYVAPGYYAPGYYGYAGRPTGKTMPMGGRNCELIRGEPRLTVASCSREKENHPTWPVG
jgi:hypothetical protein